MEKVVAFHNFVNPIIIAIAIFVIALMAYIAIRFSDGYDFNGDIKKNIVVGGKAVIAFTHRSGSISNNVFAGGISGILIFGASSGSTEFTKNAIINGTITSADHSNYGVLAYYKNNAGSSGYFVQNLFSGNTNTAIEQSNSGDGQASLTTNSNNIINNLIKESS